MGTFTDIGGKISQKLMLFSDGILFVVEMLNEGFQVIQHRVVTGTNQTHQQENTTSLKSMFFILKLVVFLEILHANLQPELLLKSSQFFQGTMFPERGPALLKGTPTVEADEGRESGGFAIQLCGDE